jgi:Asp-tRNA(Asn)/Glu-tRNA(Gln) amidotransferase A subunit family amidase
VYRLTVCCRWRSPGPIAKTVADCALLDQVLATEAEGVPAPAHLRGLRFAVPKTVFQDDLSPAVADAFKAALVRLSAAGATVVELPTAEFTQAAAVNPRGALTSAEAYSAREPGSPEDQIPLTAFEPPRPILRIRVMEHLSR